MQYLLTEEEYKHLTDDAERGASIISDEKLQEFCTLVADKMPILWGWGDNKEKPKPWGCILSKKTEWYCDQCPAQALCPNRFKNWSK